MKPNVDKPNGRTTLFTWLELLDSSSDKVATQAFWSAHTITQSTQQKLSTHIDGGSHAKAALFKEMDSADEQVATSAFWTLRSDLKIEGKTFQNFFIGELKKTFPVPRPNSPSAVAYQERKSRKKYFGGFLAVAAPSLVLATLVTIFASDSRREFAKLEATANTLNAKTNWNGDRPAIETPAVFVENKSPYDSLYKNRKYWVFVRDVRGPDVLGKDGQVLPTYCRETGSIFATKLGDNYKTFLGAFADTKDYPPSDSMFRFFTLSPNIYSKTCTLSPPGPARPATIPGSGNNSSDLRK